MRLRYLSYALSAATLCATCANAVSASDLSQLTAHQAAAKIRSGEISSTELTQALIGSAKQQAYLNAFITLDEQAAMNAARIADDARAAGNEIGPLHGVPLVVKDNIHVAGLPNTAGTPALKNFIPATNAPVIDRLAAAGAIILGKTNMHELAFGITSDNAAFGAVGNPYAPDHSAGGSSGGSGSAIAARMAPAGLGTDTGGSVRIPAALNGIYSLRPSMGRYPSGGTTPISHTRDTAGPMARSIEDLILLDGVISGENKALSAASLKGLRIGLPRAYFYHGLDVSLAEVMEASIEKLESAGVKFVSIDMPGVSELNAKIGMPIALYESVEDLSVYLEEHNTGTDFKSLAAATSSPDVAGLFAALSVVDNDKDGIPDARIPESVYRDAIDTHRPALQKLFSDWYSDNKLDAMWVPTTTIPAQPTKQLAQHALVNGKEAATFPTYIQNTGPDSNAGYPAINIPVGLSNNGLPVGAMLAGPNNSDRKLLSIALSIEELFGALPAPK